MRFFTSDTHYAHRNICSATSRWDQSNPVIRQHPSLEEMCDALVGGINAVVGPGDELWHLGDWSFGGKAMAEELRSRISCERVHLVLGNHDKYVGSIDARGMFASVSSYAELSVGGAPLVLMHYPIQEWNGRRSGGIHLHGHVHTLPDGHAVRLDLRRLDVGVDGRRHHVVPYAPWSEDEVVELLLC